VLGIERSFDFKPAFFLIELVIVADGIAKALYHLGCVIWESHKKGGFNLCLIFTTFYDFALIFQITSKTQNRTRSRKKVL
jgi:hypothetical protein